LLLVAGVAARGTSYFIAVYFPDRPVAPDLLFETLPHVPQLGYVADLGNVLAVALLLVYAFRGNRREIPMMLALFGVMQFTRACMNVLTPLASPLNGSPYYGISSHVERALASLASQVQNSGLYGAAVSRGVMNFAQNGEFPSGHMATVFLCMLLVDKAKSPRIRVAMAVLVVAECFALLTSHQHYSIDVVGGLMLSYIVYHEYREGTRFSWIKRLVTV